jgi:hypothetical protein
MHLFFEGCLSLLAAAALDEALLAAEVRLPPSRDTLLLLLLLLLLLPPPLLLLPLPLPLPPLPLHLFSLRTFEKIVSKTAYITRDTLERYPPGGCTSSVFFAAAPRQH